MQNYFQFLKIKLLHGGDNFVDKMIGMIGFVGQTGRQSDQSEPSHSQDCLMGFKLHVICDGI